MEQHSGKLVLAILQGEDYEDTVYELNQNGFFVTMLSSTGGFLKKHSTTIMIGVEEPRLDEVLDILKRRAGQRKATVYQSFSIPMGHPYPPLMPATPVVQDVGGVVVFVMDLQHMEKFCRLPCNIGRILGHTVPGVIFMAKRRARRPSHMEDLRLNPQLRLCAKFDETSIAKFPVAAPKEMGMRVLDNCAEEHIM